MRVGEEYMVRPECAPPDRLTRRRMVKGKMVVENIRMKVKVIYVHPLGRYATLEFEGIHGNPRESFFPEQLTEKKQSIEIRMRSLRRGTGGTGAMPEPATTKR